MERGTSFIGAVLGALFLTGLLVSCKPIAGVGPVKPPSIPASGATPIPICAPITVVSIPDYLAPGPYLYPAPDPHFVFRNTVDWNTYCAPYGTIPAPPVNFSTKMIIAFSQRYGSSCPAKVTIQKVCYYGDRIEVSYDFRDEFLDDNCNPLFCAMVVGVPFTTAVEVPQSSLPVVWIENNLCPPTPTPTP